MESEVGGPAAKRRGVGAHPAPVIPKLEVQLEPLPGASYVSGRSSRMRDKSQFGWSEHSERNRIPWRYATGWHQPFTTQRYRRDAPATGFLDMNATTRKSGNDHNVMPACLGPADRLFDSERLCGYHDGSVIHPCLSMGPSISSSTSFRTSTW